MTWPPAGTHIIVLDADPEGRCGLTSCLRGAGYAVTAVDAMDEMFAAFGDGAFHCAVIESSSADTDLLAAIGRLRAAHPDVRIVVLSRTTNLKSVADTIAAGADDYLASADASESLPASLERILHHSLRGVSREEPAPLTPPGNEGVLIGASRPMVDVYKLIARVADLSSTVLITGETGSGKEQIARAIHETGRRRDLPFVAVDCAAVPETLFESEFFGHERGAFTGAHAMRKGVLELAGAGTCFLDEVGELPLHQQAKLLRALQEKSVRRVGGSEAIRISARIICATNRDLSQAVRNGTFREDLYYRLNVVPIVLPALRNRPEDISALARHFVARFSEGRDGGAVISDEMMEILLHYPWPGNVRQLENVIERTVALTSYPVLLAEDLPDEIREGDRLLRTVADEAGVETGSPLALRELNRRHIDAVLKRTGGNKLRAAQLLGIDRRTLYRILDRNRNDEDDSDTV